MKKLFYFALVLAAAVGFTSCEEKEEEVPTSEDITYVGDMSVTYYGQEISSQTDVEYNTASDSESMTIKMSGIQYVAAMPPLDIALPNIPYVSIDIYYADNVIPTTFDGEPYDTTILQSIDNVDVKVNGDMITVSYDCTISSTTMGDMVCNVTFMGSSAE